MGTKRCQICGTQVVSSRAEYCPACKKQKHEMQVYETNQRRRVRQAVKKLSQPVLSIGEIERRRMRYNQQHPERRISSYGLFVKAMEEGTLCRD